MKKSLLAILLATLWISVSEFVRNEFLLKEHWTSHYAQLGQTFPDAPINGAMWGIWSLCFAIGIYFLSRRFNLLQTVALAWFVGFLLMWLVIGNLGVLPLGILPVAIPLSLLESFVAALILHKIAPIAPPRE